MARATEISRDIAMAIAVALAVARSGAAQADAIPASEGHLRVRTVALAPRVDGRLDDAAWAEADSITDFRQREPVSGAPASERTVVRVVRHGDVLFVAVRCDDRDVGAVRAAQLRRDSDLASDDEVTLLIDGFFDRRSGFLFRTNPNGVMWDAEISGLEEVNTNWNGIWEVATSRDATGWSAEFRIPLRTLRFGAGAARAFGFNVRRTIRRANEEVLWRGYGRAQGLMQLAYEGELRDLGPLDRARDVDVKPFVLLDAAVAERDSTLARIRAPLASGKVGVDVKVALTPTLTADLTLNTDFAQVEVDKQVINLTRFPLFFPEKREFFLESSGLFSFGTEGRAQLFYSRTIGLVGDTVVPILAGARVYGRIGRWALGAMNVQTGGIDNANHLALRVKGDVFARGYAGLMFTQRAGSSVAPAAQAMGMDVDLPLIAGRRNVEPKVWIAASRTEGLAATPTAFRVSVDYPNELFDNFVSLYRIQSGFAPPLGFVRRTGIWETTGHIDYMPRPDVLGVRRLDIIAPIPAWDIIADENGSLADARAWQTAFLEWRPLGGSLHAGDSFELNVQRLFDGPTGAFDVFPGTVISAGRYWWTRGEVQFQSFSGRALSVSTVASFGGFYDGSSFNLEMNGAWRTGGHLIVSTELTRSEVTLPGGRFTAVAAGGRAEYAFTTRTDAMLFVQYANDDRLLSFNARVHYSPVVGDELYVVWTSGYTTDGAARFSLPSPSAWVRPLNGVLAIKFVHRFAP